MAVELHNIVKSFGATKVLAGTSLSIAQGEFMVLVGPSGCGKSTLLRVLAGLEEVDEGEVLIDGTRVNDLAPAKRGVAMVFQSYALYPHMDVRQNMAFGLKLGGASREEIATKVEQAAELLSISHLLDRRPKALSGGQRQRVAIGRAIVRQPKVFLFDEPLSNLDAELRVRMRYEFAKLHQRLRTTTVYVTHDQVEAMTLADRIAVMDRGHVIQIGTPETLYEAPETLFVAGFIGSPKMNLLPGTVVAVDTGRVSVTLRDGTVVQAAVEPGSLKAGDAVTLGVRPEHLRLAPTGLAARVTLVESLGNIRFAYLGTELADDPLVIQLSGQRVGEGEEVTVAADPADCHLFDSQGAACRRLGRSPGSLAA